MGIFEMLGINRKETKVTVGITKTSEGSEVITRKEKPDGTLVVESDTKESDFRQKAANEN